MTFIWTFILFFNIIRLPGSFQMNIINQPNSVITAASGENVTLHCFQVDKGGTDPILWYKQAAGHEPCLIVTVHKFASGPVFEDNFKSPRITIKNIEKNCHLKITTVEPSDEAMYYCGLKRFAIKFGKGTYLSVRGKTDVGVSVNQNSVSDSVPAGASVTLQCSVLSESRAAELQVLWFRAAPSQSHPQIIYTHHNSSLQCESSTHTCVYNLSKNIFSLNDTGTYYCAVALCGKIIFGNGTRVQLEKSVDPVVIFLSLALGVCVLILFTHIITCKWRNCDCGSVRFHPDSPNKGRSTADLYFLLPKKNTSQDSVYSEVVYSSFN